MKKVIIGICLLFLSSCSLFWGPSEKQLNATPEEKQKEKIIVALWDSLTAWYGVKKEENYPTKLQETLSGNGYNYKVINGWISGDTSAGLLSRSALYLEQKPDIVIITIGANDGLRWLSIEKMEKNIWEIITLFVEKDVDVVVAWMDIPPTLGLSYRSKFKKVYSSLPEKHPEIKFLDFFLEDVALRPSLNIRDNIHPNAEGYDIIVNNLYTFLDKQGILIK